MPQSDACSFRRKWEDENGETAMLLLSADRSAAPQCLSPIARSWERCRELGLVRATTSSLNLLAEGELKRRKEQHRTLVQLAASELSVLQRAIAGADGVILLADPNGTILDGCGDNSFIEKARSVSLRPGATWTEGLEGTNAIGTALEEQRLVQIVGDQHFLDENRFLICTAIPVMSPTGQVAGILDISGDVRNPPNHSSMLVQLASARIEHAWVSRHSAHDLLVAFHPHPNWLGTPHEGVMAFQDEILVAANPVALRLLGLASAAINRIQWSEIFRNQPACGRVELYARNHSGMFCASIQKTQGISVAMPGTTENISSEILIQDDGIWDSDAIQMLSKARRAYEASVPILLQGETGTGKEVFVRAIHRHSSRASAPLVPVNCAAIPEGLQEAELFGYEDGAFTGARKKGNPGYIRRADGGTLFLDEIGDMPLALQAQLLRVLQDGEVTPLGASRSVRVDFRLVAATHRDLQAAVAEGKFRADLYYRLRHMVLFLPPLRKRRNLAGILDAMLTNLGTEARGIRLTAAARQKLLEHSWPGNLRELSNLLRTLVALAEDGSWIDTDSLPQEITVSMQTEPSGKLSDLTDELLRKAIDEHSGNMSAAARQLGLHRSTLYRRLSGS
jgi:sigma-54 dependent transcriptional regulator, acetoin dehydrogenase operon transcriptional activator AcoR